MIEGKLHDARSTGRDEKVEIDCHEAKRTIEGEQNEVRPARKESAPGTRHGRPSSARALNDKQDRNRSRRNDMLGTKRRGGEETA